MALDEKGITLAEIRNKYPPDFQILNYDVLMDSDSMYKPKVISSFDLIINSILTLLFIEIQAQKVHRMPHLIYHSKFNVSFKQVKEKT